MLPLSCSSTRSRSRWLGALFLVLATSSIIVSASLLRHEQTTSQPISSNVNYSTLVRYIYKARNALSAHPLFAVIRNKNNKHTRKATNKNQNNKEQKWRQRQLTTCSAANQCSFVDSFKQIQKFRWKVSDGYANGVPFDCWWSASSTSIDQKNGQLKLTLSKQNNHGKPYKSGQVMSKNWHGYGCYEVRMRPIAQSGLITTFFSYTGPWDAAPGKSKAHNEIDIEFVWKKGSGKLSLQANYFTNGQGGNEHMIPIDFNPAASMNNYAFKWTSKAVTWYVNGKLVYKTSKNIPKASQAPHKIMMSFWPVSGQAAKWGGHFAYQGHRTVAYEAMRFTKGENCKIKNWFPA
ncbi:unnamed protein product [Agarophyton chilense]